MKPMNLFRTAAVAGLIGVGIAGTVSAPAQARAYRVCNEWGCHTVYSNSYRHNYYRDSRYDNPYHRGYYGNGYNGYYNNGYYGGSYRVCNRWGCHRARRHNEPRVEFGVRF